MQISSVKEIHRMTQMITAKHALKIIWTTDTSVTDELLLGFQDETLRAKWHKSLKERARAYTEETPTAQEPKDHDINAVTEPNDTSEVDHFKQKEMSTSGTNESVDEELYDDMDAYKDMDVDKELDVDDKMDCFKEPIYPELPKPRARSLIRPVPRPPRQDTKLAAESECDSSVPKTKDYKK
jgi:hypothetical protein